MAEPVIADPAEVDRLVLPDLAGACVANIVPALLEYPPLGDGWMPPGVDEAGQVVLFVVDGLGWNQLKRRAAVAPILNGAVGGAITTVAPSTTAAALTSITTGTAPGEHGIVGYKIRVGGETLNALRWTTARGDARQRLPPREFQPVPAFGARSPAVVNKAEFRGSGLTVAHLDGVDYRPYGTVATLVHEVGAAVAGGSRLVYTYYDGLDRVGHERGHGAVYDAELAFIDRLVGDLRAALDHVDPSIRLLVTADHGQVHTGDRVTPVADEVLARCVGLSGEDRFLWLHAPGAQAEVERMASEVHGEHAWVVSVDQVLDQGWFGARVSTAARDRLGDVALVAKGTAAFVDPTADRPRLLARHGSLTPAEMYVPLLSI